ncbi:MAG: nuclear transport factor 2 family protein [Sphingomicrobium sp.]
MADDAADVRAAESAWNTAIMAKDGAALDRWMSADFQLVAGAAETGTAVPRAAWRANLQRMTLKQYETEVTDVQLAGDYAVASLTGRWSVEMGGRSLNGPFLLRDVWTWRKTGWQVVRRFVVDQPATPPAATASRP